MSAPRPGAAGGLRLLFFGTPEFAVPTWRGCSPARIRWSES